MKKTGELLKKSREEKQLSIHEIGLSLKINNKILKAIEEGDLKNLPAKTFLRGFVQSYAQYLKLNQDEILKIFTEEMGTTKPHTFQLAGIIEPAQTTSISTAAPAPTVAKPVAKKESSYSDEETPVTVTSGKQFKTVTLTASVIILITLILITKRVIDKYQNEATLPAEAVESIAASPQVTYVAPVEPSKQPAPTTTSSTEAEKNADSTAQPTTATPAENSFVSSATTGPSPKSALQQQAPIPPATKPEVAKPSTPPTATTTASNPLPATQPTSPAASTTTTPATTTPPASTASSATSSKASSTGSTASTSSASSQSTSPAAVPTPAAKAENKSAESITAAAAAQEVKPAAKNIELIIEAFDAVDIEYSTTNGKNEKMRLEPEQLHTIKTKSGLKLSVSNGGAVNIIVNGKDVGVPGTLGKPVKLTF